MLWNRFAALREIESLDPARDTQRITQLSGEVDFAFDVQVSLELALFRTYGIPSISKVLDATGEFEHRGQKRVDDTALILGEILQGPDTARGRRAVRQLNKIHSAYEISNDDYLYTLCTFVVQPTRWIERFGWRPLSKQELDATVVTYRRMGQLMNIKELPESYEGFARFLDEYEREHFRFAESNQRVALATLRVFEGQLPERARGWFRQVALSLIDEPLLRALGLPLPAKRVRQAVEGALRARARVLRFVPPSPMVPLAAPSYPMGWAIEDLGPAHATKGCPFHK